MKEFSDNLVQLGFGPWFQERVDAQRCGNFEIARVTAVHKNSYILSNGVQEVFAELVGKMLYAAQTPLDFPTVGDWVYAHFFDQNTFSVIHGLLPRKSLLKRKAPGKKVDFQLIAANVDTALIIQALDADFNLRRLERYLVMVHEGRIQPVVLLSKSDLLPPAETAAKIEQVKAVLPHLPVTVFSNTRQSGYAAVTTWFKPGETYCLLGSSGVGKTTLLNNLLGAELLATREVRKKDGRGRHATTARQLLTLASGAMVVDTPGLREVGNLSVEEGLEETFADIHALAAQCRFKDCTHVHEHGCAVLDALGQGRLLDKRYQNYVKMSKEAAYNNMSYVERRKKDKRLGKFYKSVMKKKKDSQL